MTATKANLETHRVAILADSETATGFRLAGAEVIEASPDTARETLERLITEGQYGLIGVDSGLLADPAGAMARVMRGRDLPILLPLPSMAEAFTADAVDAKAYMGKLVHDTVGFDIKL